MDYDKTFTFRLRLNLSFNAKSLDEARKLLQDTLDLRFYNNTLPRLDDEKEWELDSEHTNIIK
jgi:hypothetical protein